MYKPDIRSSESKPASVKRKWTGRTLH